MLEDAPHLKARLLNATLAEFDISETRGYLPETDPPISWDDDSAPKLYGLRQLGEELSAYLAAGVARKKIEEFSTRHVRDIPWEDIARLLDRFEKRAPRMLHMFMRTLSFLAHAYVFGSVGDEPVARIPAGIARLLCEIAKRLHRHPVLSYDSYALQNWYRVDRNSPITVENLALIQNFGGGVDEEWFTTIHIEIEKNAGEIPRFVLDTMRLLVGPLPHHTHVDSFELDITLNLKVILGGLKEVNRTFKRMPERCDPYIYYNRVRPYIHGWKRNPALPNGVVYEGVSEFGGEGKAWYYGETGAQSSIFPMLYAFFGIDFNKDTYLAYLREMREYMPAGHRAFICFVESYEKVGVSIMKLAKENKCIAHLCKLCLLEMIEFLTVHRGYAEAYIGKQHQKCLANPTAVGTGGSPYMRFLSEHIDRLQEVADSL